jgi:hypothetical protein
LSSEAVKTDQASRPDQGHFQKAVGNENVCAGPTTYRWTTSQSFQKRVSNRRRSDSTEGGNKSKSLCSSRDPAPRVRCTIQVRG